VVKVDGLFSFLIILMVMTLVRHSYSAEVCQTLFLEFTPPEISLADHQIPFSELQNFEYFNYAFYGKYATADYRGKKIFLKSKSTNEQEIKWLEKLNAADLGTKFLGITKYRNEVYLVTEFVDGKNSKFGPESSGIVLTKKMEAEIKRQIELLIEMDAFPDDVQFMLTHSGQVILIDAEFESISEIPNRPDLVWQNQEVAKWRQDPLAIEKYIDEEVARIVTTWNR
jgi:hypothetical protein